jgi:hypothetical protein
MRINVAHLRERAAGGGWIDFAVFDAKSTTGQNDQLLHQLTMEAKSSGLKIDQSALAFMSGGRMQFYGDKNLVAYLARSGVSRWTHSLTI